MLYQSDHIETWKCELALAKEKLTICLELCCNTVQGLKT